MNRTFGWRFVRGSSAVKSMKDEKYSRKIVIAKEIVFILVAYEKLIGWVAWLYDLMN
jgi:hypothetical protein